jgi:pantoate--beta-alanine ligase
MKVIESVGEMRRARAGLEGRVALVPTMGALHAGHISLVKRARGLADHVVASLFVNPAQFGPGEDFSRYPRPRERDLEKFREAGVEIVFAPAIAEVYPPGESARVDPGAIGRVLEGAHRAGHFTGVATVVTKLFAIVRPDVAVFGEKDAQQVRVIRQVTRDLMLGTEIAVAPTVREPDGLAMSSRNVFLKPGERAVAPVLYLALGAVRAAWGRGERRGEALRQAALSVLAEVPAVAVEYVSVADPDTLAELDDVKGAALVSMAVRLGGTRLIDNVTLPG